MYNGLALMLLSMHPRFVAHRFAGPAIAVGGLIFSSSIFALVWNREKYVSSILNLGKLDTQMDFADYGSLGL